MRLAALLLASAPPVVTARAAVAAALPDPDLSPLIATIGLPRADEGARLAPRGELRWRWSVAAASHSIRDTAGGESLLFDGETTRLAFAAEMAVTDRLQLGIELPYLLHESGGLDSVVERWHDWFGFPDGLRAMVDDDRLDFRYEDDGASALALSRNQRGPGDLRLLAAWQLGRGARSATALRASLKLPTGDPDRLTGSGGFDLGVGLAGDYREPFGWPGTVGFYRAGVTAVGRPDRLPERAERLIGTLAGGLSVEVGERLELAVQGLLRSAAYDSELELIGEPSLLLNVGGTIRLGEHLHLAIAVGEDVAVNTAPDVTFGLSLRYEPAASRQPDGRQTSR